MNLDVAGSAGSLVRMRSERVRTEISRYVASFRKKEMYLRTRMTDFTIYGEVNSLLRRHFHCTQPVWKQQAGVHRKATPTHRFPHWGEWGAGRLRTFETICGDEMRAYGYLQ